jgi:hypothetical protein
MKQPDRKRKLVLSIKGRESRRFIRLFHGWARHKQAAGDRLEQQQGGET